MKELLAQGNYSDKEIKNIRRYRYLDSTEINDFIKLAEQRMGEHHWIAGTLPFSQTTGVAPLRLQKLSSGRFILHFSNIGNKKQYY